MENQKMRLGKYISIAVISLIFGILAWVLVVPDLTDPELNKWIVIIMGVITLIAFVITTINICIYSIIGFIKSLRIKQENGLWKILTLVFRIGMLVFAALIAILFFVWMGVGLSWISDFRNAGIDFSTSSANAFLYMIYTDVSDWLKYIGKTDLPSIFITIFVFIMLWSSAGITFEILKKFLGGYKPKKPKENIKS